ncbi:MAG: MFS transporter [Anaerolineae bacterium]|nr:MFS transporter [Anaerolineae bacterium]
MDSLAERPSRRNLVLLIVDYVAFSVGMGFLGPTTVLPTLIRLLGGSPMVVGSLGAIQAGAFCFPQLAAGRRIVNRPLVRSFVVLTGVLSRVCLALPVMALSLFSRRAPGVALAILLAGVGLFNVIDAFASVGWYELFAKGVPPSLRGRVLGVAQTLSGIALVGVGMGVEAILARPDPFPGSYTLLIFLAAAFMAICPLAMALVREQPRPVESAPQPAWGDYFPRLVWILRKDHRFAWVNAVRWLAGFAEMGSAFYVLFAADRLHTPQQTIGLFISAGVVGSLVCGAILGPLGDRKGPALVIWIGLALRSVCPALALLAPHVAGYHPWMAPGIMVLVFALSSMAGGSYMIGFTNYLLEISPVGDRPTYMALFSTLGGVLLVAPLVAGWVVQVASYELLFVVMAALGVAGLLTAARSPAGAPSEAASHG